MRAPSRSAKHSRTVCSMTSSDAPNPVRLLSAAITRRTWSSKDSAGRPTPAMASPLLGKAGSFSARTRIVQAGRNGPAEGQTRAVELLIARNPDPESTLPYLLRLPIGDGLVFRTKDTWPRTAALYCHPVPAAEWPDPPEIVERVPLRACARRGAAIDVVADRGRLQRSQLVYTKARGRDMVFWQSPSTRKQARPEVTLPRARAGGIPELEIVVDAH